MDKFIDVALQLGTFGLLLCLCALLGRPAERFGVPVVFLFLAIGMLAGSEGLLGVAFDNYELAFRLGTAALILILLDGGLNTTLAAMRSVAGPALMLATVGVLATAALVACFAHWLGLGWPAAMLLGAVVSSTDAAAVFAVLRGSQLHLDPRVGHTLEIESGVNDPMAVILTVVATGFYLNAGAPDWRAIVLSIPVQLLVGGGLGLAFGLAARLLLTRVRLATAGLYPILTLGVGLLAFGIATLFAGSGFLAVFIAALLLGNSRLPYRSGLTRIHDALAWLAQVGMFLMLGLLAFPSQLRLVAVEGVMIALFLTLVARPWRSLPVCCRFDSRFARRFTSGGSGCAGRCRSFSPRFPFWLGCRERCMCSTSSSSLW